MQLELAASRRRLRMSVIPALAGLALLFAAPVCGSPTPEPTPQPRTAIAVVAPVDPSPSVTPVASTFAFSEIPNLPTPSSSSAAMILGGVLWVDGATPVGEVIAYIGGKECGRGQSFLLPDAGPTFIVTVAAAAEQPGCGAPGTPVTLTLNGRPMNDMVDWQPGFAQPRTFFAGPAVAQYWGTFIRRDKSVQVEKVVPYVGDVACGTQVDALLGNEEVGYQVVAVPEQLRPGCGREGVVVTLRLEGTMDGRAFDTVLATAPWEPGPLTHLATVDLASVMKICQRASADSCEASGR